MKILTVASQKGGAGKTTIASHLAVAAVMDKHRVAIIDADPQGSLSDWWNLRNEPDLFYLQSTIKGMQEAIQRAQEAKIDLLLIDTPPAVTNIIEEVVGHSDLIIIPTKPSPLDIRAVVKTVDIVDRCQKPMVFVVSIAKKNARITSESAIGLSQYGTVAPIHLGDRNEFPISMIDGRTVMETFAGGRSDEEIRSLWKYIKKQLNRKILK